MESGNFDEVELFRSVQASGARALLIGRRALIALGLPVMTNDYDFWLHIDDMERFHRAVAHLDLVPNRTPEEARKVGRYKLENDITVDVLVARVVPTIDGTRVAFDDVWARRRALPYQEGIVIALPSLADLIQTKRFGARPKDAEDIRLLEVLRAEGHDE